MSSLHYHEPPRNISLERVLQHLGWLASQDMGPVLTMLALRDCPLHLMLNLDRRLSSMATLLPNSTHVATSLVARISIVHQSLKPKQQMLSLIELQWKGPTS